MEEIKILRLKTGEDVVGYVSDIDDMKVNIRTPMLIDIKSDGVSSKSMFIIRSWVPFQLINGYEVSLWNNDVMFTMEPNNEFIDYYVETVYQLERLITMKEVMEHLAEEEEIKEAMTELKGNQVH